MILQVHSDGSYLSAPKSRSRSGGFFFLSGNPIHPDQSILNGAIHIVCKILKNVMSSAAEVEIASAFINCQDAIPIRNTLIELNHPQPPTPVQVDNTTAAGFINKEIKQKRTKSIDMRFYWLQDREAQNQFNICWKPGEGNLANYFTKHFAPSYHSKVRPVYLYDRRQQYGLSQKEVQNKLLTRPKINPTDNMQGCDKHTSPAETRK